MRVILSENRLSRNNTVSCFFHRVAFSISAPVFGCIGVLCLRVQQNRIAITPSCLKQCLAQTIP